MKSQAMKRVLLAKVSAVVLCVTPGAALNARAAQDSDTVATNVGVCPATNEDLMSSRADYSVLARGDKAKFSFYEVLPSQEDRWGADRQRQQAQTKAFQMRSELSGEYQVQGDGSISIPVLGTFPADRRRVSDVRQQIECAFNAFLGHQGFVNVLGVVKQPVYVVGRVKNSGSYPFVPGMTVMHAVSLAGGFQNAVLEPWQIAELTRETEHLQSSLERASKLIARTVALSTTRTPDVAKAPPELAAVAGTDNANALVAAEATVPRRQARLRSEQESRLKLEISVATSELAARKAKLPLLDQSVSLRQQRYESLQRLLRSGSVSNPELIRAQTELVDAQDRHEQTVAAVDAAQERLDRVQRDLTTERLQSALNDQKDITQSQGDADRATGESIGAINIIRSVVDHIGATSVGDVQFTIIRQSDGGALTVRADETTPLEPGDLVQAKSKTGEATVETSRR